MTKPEKKAFKTSYIRSGSAPDFKFLFEIIDKEAQPEVNNIKKLFLRKRPKASFDSSVKYLYKILLDLLLDLRQKQDHYFYLLNQILKARVLFEKSLFEKCFELLNKVMIESEKLENYHALLLASKLEAEYLLALNFPVINEKILLNKHYKINETLKVIRKINEHFSLYELLKYRISHKGNIRSPQQKVELNDLVVSELSIIASSNLENFEIKKLHQLFQSNYLLSVGDFKSAFRSYSELILLFESNKHLWSNPPIYYLLTIEGVLDSLRSIKNYNEMELIIGKLKNLKSYSVNFNANVDCLIYLYELLPFLDRGDFESAHALMIRNNEKIYLKMHLLSLTRQAELSLYTALLLLGRHDFKGAHKLINKIFLKGQGFYYLPLYRTIRMVNLIILYELNDFDRIIHETRSIKREITETPSAYSIEKYLLKFVIKPAITYTPNRREKIWESKCAELEWLRNDVFEKQVLKIFDFTAWIESKLRKLPLNQVLAGRMNAC